MVFHTKKSILHIDPGKKEARRKRRERRRQRRRGRRQKRLEARLERRKTRLEGRAERKTIKKEGGFGGFLGARGIFDDVLGGLGGFIDKIKIPLIFVGVAIILIFLMK